MAFSLCAALPLPILIGHRGHCAQVPGTHAAPLQPSPEKPASLRIRTHPTPATGLTGLRDARDWSRRVDLSQSAHSVAQQQLLGLWPRRGPSWPSWDEEPSLSPSLADKPICCRLP